MAAYNPKWDDLGRSIQGVIDRAVNSRDFQKLNESILKTVDAVVAKQTGGSIVNKNTKKLYCNTVFKRIKEVLRINCGFWIAALMVMALMGASISGDPISEYLGVIIMVVALLGLGVAMVYSGVNTMRMISRFKAYCGIMGDNTYCALETLAANTGKSTEFVRRDLQKMMKKGFFREGHFNREQTYFLASHESFQYYEQSRIELERAQKEKEKTAPKETVARDAQVQEILERGNNYIAQIRKCNDDIPGEEISQKISRIELLVQRIFERVESNPEIIPDLKKLMEYYLPMTVKLLKAYADMDEQPVQGETIRSAKREIEGTLDTINLAFEKLLDDLFAETAMDVSSDISVLNTLLAQEGLASDELSKLKEQSQS